jgi:hypothetical protein
MMREAHTVNHRNRRRAHGNAASAVVLMSTVVHISSEVTDWRGEGRRDRSMIRDTTFFPLVLHGNGVDRLFRPGRSE